METEILKKSLYFRKRNFLIFQETELSYTSGKRTFLYFGKGIFITRGIFRTTSIFRTMAYLEPEAYSEHCQTSMMERFAEKTT